MKARVEVEVEEVEEVVVGGWWWWCIGSGVAPYCHVLVNIVRNWVLLTREHSAFIILIGARPRGKRKRSGDCVRDPIAKRASASETPSLVFTTT